MWIVRVALNRPYTFVVLALVVFIAGPMAALHTPTDIFPTIDIPVISAAWSYTGLNAEELSGRLTSPYQRALTALVDNIEHLESTTVNGWSIVKIFLQPGASLDTANAQVSSASQWTLRLMPPGTLPPEFINYSASSVPVLQLGVSGRGLSEQELNDQRAEGEVLMLLVRRPEEVKEKQLKEVLAVHLAGFREKFGAGENA